MRIVQSLLLLSSLSFPVFAQTPEACRANLQHFDVHDYGEVYSFRPRSSPKVKLPTRLLFSESGIEVYAATFPEGRNNFYGQVSDMGMKVLIVYQDEPVRQAMIKELRDKHALPPPGFGALVDNLKYAEIWFLPDSRPDKGFPEKWHIGQVKYLQPNQCSNVFQNDVHPSLQNAYKHTVNAVAYTDEIKDANWSIDKDPFWMKAFEAMLAWAKKCSSLIDP